MLQASGSFRGFEVTHVSKHGIWRLWTDEELFLTFEQFPWFRQATLDQIPHVEAPGLAHLYWPDLDIDLSVTLASGRNNDSGESGRAMKPW